MIPIFYKFTLAMIGALYPVIMFKSDKDDKEFCEATTKASDRYV